MNNLAKKHIILGITGGIAAYKSAELTRLLSKTGAEVRVVMTTEAKAFITPLTLQALSGFPVRDSLWDEEAEKAMSHIELAKWADLILIAPATANCIAKLACGIADDLLTTLCLASTAPLFIAPSMNQAMWHHPATQNNINILKTRNVLFLGPDEGTQACGDVGLGRMLEPINILEFLETKAKFANQSSLSHELCSGEKFFANKSILITAGPTQEAIDPVRYISNHSSGKMGYALAEIAHKLGAKVTLISGPTQLDCPEGVTRIDVKSAQEMFDAVMANMDNKANGNYALFVGAAAVADYRSANISPTKIKKIAHTSINNTNESNNTMTLELIKNPDILASVAALRNKPFVIGFAAETDNLLEYAKQKLVNKGLDMIIANSTKAFYQEENRGWIITPEKIIEIPLMNKKEMAEKILEIAAQQIFYAVK